MFISTQTDRNGGIAPVAQQATAMAAPPVQGGADFASTLATETARTAATPAKTSFTGRSGGRDSAPASSAPASAAAPAPGSRLAGPDAQGNIYAQPRLRPGKSDEANGSTQVATHSAGEYSIADLIDIINPLQHIPVVATIYRAVTGDTIKPDMRIAGGALFGGPIGMLLSAGDAMVEQVTGRDVGGNVVAMVDPSMAPITRQSLPAVAQAGQAPAPAAKVAMADPAPVATALAAPVAAQQAAKAAVAPPVAQPFIAPRQANANAQARDADGRPAQADPRKIPEMTPAAFDALMKSLGATPIDADAAAAAALPQAPKARPATAADAAPQPPVPNPASITAAATPEPAVPVSLVPDVPVPAAVPVESELGSAAAAPNGVTTIDGARFFPANRVSAPSPRPVPLVQPAKAASYDDALSAMRQALDKYQASGTKNGGAQLTGSSVDRRF